MCMYNYVDVCTLHVLVRGAENIYGSILATNRQCFRSVRRDRVSCRDVHEKLFG